MDRNITFKSNDSKEIINSIIQNRMVNIDARLDGDREIREIESRIDREVGPFVRQLIYSLEFKIEEISYREGFVDGINLILDLMKMNNKKKGG